MQLHCDLDLVKSRTLLASAFIVYLCSEQQHIRVEFVKRWVDIQQDLIGDLKDFNLSSVLGEDICTRKWKLPQDIIIFENALIVHSLESEVNEAAIRFPFYFEIFFTYSSRSILFLLGSFCHRS
jgi:hypothetical protein